MIVKTISAVQKNNLDCLKRVSINASLKISYPPGYGFILSFLRRSKNAFIKIKGKVLDKLGKYSIESHNGLSKNVDLRALSLFFVPRSLLRYNKKKKGFDKNGTTIDKSDPLDQVYRRPEPNLYIDCRCVTRSFDFCFLPCAVYLYSAADYF